MATQLKVDYEANHESLVEIIQHLEEINGMLEKQKEDLKEEVKALQQELTVQLMQKGKLKAARERELGEGAEAAVVIDVIEYWASRTGHERAKVSAAGARADAVRKGIRLGHEVEELKEAIDGAAEFPFVVNKERSRTGTEKQRYDDLPTVFRDEVQIARMRKLAQRVPPGAKASEPQPVMKQTPIDRVLVAIWDQAWTCPETNTWLTACPTCYGQDRLTIHKRDDGIVTLACSRGCELWRLLKAMDLQPRDLWDGADAAVERRSEMPEHLREASELLLARLAGSR